MRFLRHNTAMGLVGALLGWSLLVMGCARSSRVAAPVESQPWIETVAFTAAKERIELIDAATSLLVATNFTITLANDRIGLLQTDYVPLSSVRGAMTDTLGMDAGLDELVVRVTLNADARGDATFVQIKGAFRRIAGAPSSSDAIQGLYWLDRVAEKIADAAEVPYVRQLSDSTYVRAMGSSPKKNTIQEESPGMRGAIKAGAILIAVIFAVTLAVGTFGPGSNRPPPDP